ncbi:MAG: hypothetical protein J7L47_03560 [Candidatus Odinarchaeota archaeon]|nr:hypothetical protein [Candidatus Odinarchaeota archaeon]
MIVEEIPTIETLAIALWAMVVGYYIELFGYYLLLKWQKDKKPYQLILAVFFLMMALGRIFFLMYDFYFPNELIWWRLGTLFQWLAITTVSIFITIFTFEKRLYQIAVSLPPFIIAFVILAVPATEITLLRYVLGIFIAPIYVTLIPGLYFYLALVTSGQIRKSTFLQGLGFSVLYIGRILHASLIQPLLWQPIALIVAPAIVMVALLLIVMGVQYLS